MSTSTLSSVDPQELLRRAHEGVYRWPASFRPGQFDLTVRCGSVEYQGTAGVSDQGTVEVDLPHAGELGEWAEGEVRMLIDHRRTLRYEDADGRHGLSIDESAENGTLIRVQDSMESSYRLDEDGLIYQIVRAPNGNRIVITILDRAQAPNNTWLSHTFTVVHQNSDRSIKRVDAYEDRHVEIDGIVLPRERRVIIFKDRVIEERRIILEGGVPSQVAA